MDLALDNLQWLICHETKPNQTKLDILYLCGKTLKQLQKNVNINVQ